MKVENSAGLSCTSASSRTLTRPATVGRPLEQVVDLQLGLAEEGARALLLEGHHLPQQHAHRSLGDAAVVAQGGRPLAGEVVEHRAQILEVEQRQLPVVAVLEHQGQHARLGVVEAQHLAERQRSERRDGGAQLGPQRAAQAQQLDREAARLPGGAGLLGPLLDLAGWLVPGAASPATSPFTSETKTGTPARREPLGQQLQGLGLSRCRWLRR